MWNKIQRIYIGQNLVRPPDIEVNYEWAQSIYKSWMKIKKAVLRFQCTNSSGSWWKDYSWGIVNSQDWMNNLIRTWGGYGYSGYGDSKYWCTWDGPGTAWIVYPSSSHTKYWGAVEMALTEETLEVKVWQTLGSRNFTNSISLSSAQQSYVHSIFISNDVQLSTYFNDSNVSNVTATITYGY